ncbi:hypothetical protein JOY44_17680 [Phormidium sp. CLA17]|uniref:hypothetical protein n=1 Tax=Leptolyngbya sp. Cla-17 TaxID=2803751 RepID=UPI001492E20C|nr:hypothetical protein [Leptolyngbya sp. Cla-17]MBM0743419.1 hypothetical protein [Leptolyngbya sp. Cla-17]
MDTLQQQLSVLNTKVDGLYQLIEQLSDRVDEVVSACQKPDQANRFGAEMALRSRSYRIQSKFESTMEHKDVLVDHDLDASFQTAERQLSPEIQIQRLTAQLTAAYSRMAALEDQLVAQRIH